MWIGLWKTPDDFHGRFVHELVHVLNNFGDCIGDKQVYLHDEPFAYFAGWLTREFYKKAIKAKLC